MKSSLEISKSLKNACQFLDKREHQQLLDDVGLVCEQFINPNFSVAVLAPFNFGKSTLINALLGQEIMPTEMVRTTGAVISLKYGDRLTTSIALESGKVIKSNDTEILKEFAVLNRKGQRREDVLSVRVSYPHHLLKNGVEFFDLPGTNDQEEQDILVRDKLLQVDLVLQILNAGQAFTLGEQETLRQWLINRGINTVIFVLNKLNTYTSQQDQEEILEEVSSTTEQFNQQLKFDLPQVLKTFYRVDALPAIKAKQKRNKKEILASGIIGFEAALLTIISLQKKKVDRMRLFRVIAVARRVKSVLKTKIIDVKKEIKDAENIRNNIIEKGKQRELYLKKQFKREVEAYRNWLSLDILLGTYQIEAAKALEKYQFDDWQKNKFQSTISRYTQAIQNSANQSCDEFQKVQSAFIDVSLPSNPKASLPQRQDRNPWQWTTDIFNKGANRQRLDEKYEKEKWDAYKSAIYSYLSEFSKNSLNSLNQYEQKVESLIVFPIPPESNTLVKKRSELNALNISINTIQAIENFKNDKINTYQLNGLERLKTFFIFWKNWLSCFFLY